MSNYLFRKKSLENIQRDVAQGSENPDEHFEGLSWSLGVRDLTFMGIAAIIGAGSFSSMGSACASGGPGVVLLFIICGIACGFTALCYAEFASRVPVSGSAYTYAYASFGELFAWIIGWALLMEYAIGNIYVAFAWSGYFTNLLDSVGLHLPEWLTCNYKSASLAAASGNAPGEALTAWQTAPMLGSLRIIFDLPALCINLLVTALVYIGVKESRNVGNAMVILKLAILVIVILVGAFYIDIDNWTPFLPNGFGGVMAGVSSVFFAYIGFDAVSTLADESKNPERDLPRGILNSLVICTIVYVVLALVITGMVVYTSLGVTDPLAEVFALKGVKWMVYLVSVGAVIAITTVLLVFQLGQPRIWLSMSRDGLLPKPFQKIHPKYKTPSFATIITGLVVGVPILFTDEQFVLDFTSIATIFAFILVCGGVLLLPKRDALKAKQEGGFALPYINGKWLVTVILCSILTILLIFSSTRQYLISLFDTTQLATNLPMLVFMLFSVIIAVLSYRKNYSLIPVLGVITCSYLLTGMTLINWLWFLAWLALGLVIYFAYSRHHSKLNTKG
ncbi:MAG: amino acid permease [Sphingobacteriales bacterium]|nr:amino acid permease [Sphingobacteriales bacterium]